MGTRYTFEPDYAVAPGATLKELLDTKGISQVDLSMRTGLAMKTINQIVSGVAPLSIETAGRLEMALGVPAQFWNRLELNYRETLARTEATGRLEQDVEWLKEIPLLCGWGAIHPLGHRGDHGTASVGEGGEVNAQV